MFLAQLLVKMAHVEVEIHLPVEPQSSSTVATGTRFTLGWPRRRSISPSYPRCSQRARQRRIWRSLGPRISAAWNHGIVFAMARKITSCTFIARSTAALG